MIFLASHPDFLLALFFTPESSNNQWKRDRHIDSTYIYGDRVQRDHMTISSTSLPLCQPKKENKKKKGEN